MITLYKYCKRHGELKQGDIQNHPNGLRCATLMMQRAIEYIHNNGWVN